MQVNNVFECFEMMNEKGSGLTKHNLKSVL